MERSQGSKGSEDVEKSVTDGVGEWGFVGMSAGEKVVTKAIERFVASAARRAGGRENGEAEFALEKKGEKVGRDAVVVVGALETVESQGSDGSEEGWEGNVDVGGGVGEVGGECCFFIGNVE